jgi:hypothetical protein
MANLTALANCIAAGGPAGSTNALQFNAGSGAFSGVGPLTNGQLVIGSTGGAPQAATLTPGSGISITNGAGSISISVTGGGAYNVPIAGSMSTNGVAATLTDAINALKIVSAAVGNDSTQGSIFYKPVSGSWSAKFKLYAFRGVVNYNGVGVAAFESSTGKLFAASHSFNSFSNNSGLIVRIDTAASISGYSGGTNLLLRSENEFPNYWMLHSDGTNIYAYTSFDEQNWNLEYQMPLTSAFSTAPDSVGIFISPWNLDGTPRAMTVYCYDFTIF